MGGAGSVARPKEKPGARESLEYDSEKTAVMALAAAKQTDSILVVQLRSATGFPTTVPSEGEAFVAAHMLDEDGGPSRDGATARWPHRRSGGASPVWRHWRCLGPTSAAAGASGSVRFELFGTSGVSATVRVEDLAPVLAGGSPSEAPRWSGERTTEVSVDVGDGRAACVLVVAAVIAKLGALLAPRWVFAIRHAESTWNRAVAAGDVVTMLGQIDHGLSAKGVSQASSLADLFRGPPEREATVPADDEVAALEARFLEAPKIFSSPLRRTVQTALLALGRHSAAVEGGVTLLSSLREVRSKHGRDNCVTAVGGAIRELAAGPQKGASLSLQLES